MRCVEVLQQCDVTKCFMHLLISGDIIQLVKITIIDETGSLIAVIAYLRAPPVREVVINFQHGISLT